MIILNASRVSKSIMTDRGDLIQINPGETSPVVVASVNLIKAAINSGQPEQIGIIISGGYELEIANKVTGALPYIYTTLEEAKDKLIDHSDNYKAALNSEKINMANLKEIEEANKVIEELKSQLEEYKTKLEKSNSDAVVNELKSEVDRMTAEVKSLNTSKVSLDSKCKELQDNLENATKTITDLRSQLGTKTQDYMGMLNLNKELDKKIESLESRLANVEDTSELKAKLAESIKTIESMKESFNEACTKFGISKTEDGEWISSMIS